MAEAKLKLDVAGREIHSLDNEPRVAQRRGREKLGQAAGPGAFLVPFLGGHNDRDLPPAPGNGLRPAVDRPVEQFGQARLRVGNAPDVLRCVRHDDHLLDDHDSHHGHLRKSTGTQGVADGACAFPWPGLIPQ